LTALVVSPAFDGAVVENCAGVSGAAGDGGGRVSVAEVDCCSWCVDVVVVAVAYFSIPVPTPAGDLSVVE